MKAYDSHLYFSSKPILDMADFLTLNSHKNSVNSRTLQFGDFNRAGEMKERQGG